VDESIQPKVNRFEAVEFDLKISGKIDRKTEPKDRPMKGLINDGPSPERVQEWSRSG
jgi:hypothetical protein